MPSGAEPEGVPGGPAGLANCEGVPALRSRLEGKLSAKHNPDDKVKAVLAEYGMEHPDTFGGSWIDRDSGGVLMVRFTDDPEPHRAAILARRPSRDDLPLGKRDDVVIDVVQVRFSRLEVAVLREELMGGIGSEDWRSFGLDGSGYDVHASG